MAAKNNGDVIIYSIGEKMLLILGSERLGIDGSICNEARSLPMRNSAFWQDAS